MSAELAESLEAISNVLAARGRVRQKRSRPLRARLTVTCPKVCLGYVSFVTGPRMTGPAQIVPLLSFQKSVPHQGACSRAILQVAKAALGCCPCHDADLCGLQAVPDHSLVMLVTCTEPA